MSKDLLIEIGTEELPPKALKKLSQAFLAGIRNGLGKADLTFADIKPYASPRRLALLVRDLAEQTPHKTIERRGPALQAAYGEDGCPTQAALGFARSCGVEVEELDKLETDKGSWLMYTIEQAGQDTTELVPALVSAALDDLPIPKRMRWGDLDAQFVRPVHWLVLLFGDSVIETELLSVRAGRTSYGHRFHHPEAIEIPMPSEYEVLLESEGKVIADFNRRSTAVRAQVESLAMELNGQAVIDPALLDEVTAMVEWPVAIAGQFEERFLTVPQEALISTMAANQKYFHLVDSENRLMPYFITISNIESRHEDKVREGNERVIRPRFADAKFFWKQDRKQRLDSHLEQLKAVVFQKQLGTLYDKTRRMAKLAAIIATQLGADKQQAIRAAELSKCDLLTEMVGEFPNLQGVMGRYYAQHDGETSAVADAIDQHYCPRFSGDVLPQGPISQAIALADRIDTLIGIFAIGQHPTGDKDPYALRRAALGVLRIMIEGSLDLDLHQLLSQAAQHYDAKVKADNAVEPVMEFILDRLHAYYQEQGIRADVLDAVTALKPVRPVDIDKRIQAVNVFRQLPEAESLAAANKRSGNILKKIEGTLPATIKPELLTEAAEQKLYQALTELTDQVKPMLANGNYEPALQQLADLRQPVDTFFDDVMVMVEDMQLRDNRIALLNQLHGLFLEVADISRLHN
jgi:glycyl-tRNA synthetase beta chain